MVKRKIPADNPRFVFNESTVKLLLGAFGEKAHMDRGYLVTRYIEAAAIVSHELGRVSAVQQEYFPYYEKLGMTRLFVQNPASPPQKMLMMSLPVEEYMQLADRSRIKYDRFSWFPAYNATRVQEAGFCRQIPKSKPSTVTEELTSVRERGKHTLFVDKGGALLQPAEFRRAFVHHFAKMQKVVAGRRVGVPQDMFLGFARSPGIRNLAQEPLFQETIEFLGVEDERSANGQNYYWLVESTFLFMCREYEVEL